MLFFKKKYEKLPKIEFSGITLEGPLGFYDKAGSSKNYHIVPPVPSFLTLTPPRDGVLQWISHLQELREETVLGVNLSRDIQHSFALLYDFVDFLIVDTGSEDGTSDVSDITATLDELLTLRLCYERYTRILLRITDGLTLDEVAPLLEYCRLTGIDGIIIKGEKRYNYVYEKTQGRIPIAVRSDSPQEIQSFIQKGIPVETELGAIQRLKLLKSLTKTNA